MPYFGERSKKNLAELHPDLQRVFNFVIPFFDFAIIEGHRGKEAQEEAFKNGTSTKHWPDSPHNEFPSKAADCSPSPIDWVDVRRFYFFAGFVMLAAIILKVKLRWGGDWDGDTNVKENKFNDLPHFELL